MTLSHGEQRTTLCRGLTQVWNATRCLPVAYTVHRAPSCWRLSRASLRLLLTGLPSPALPANETPPPPSLRSVKQLSLPVIWPFMDCPAVLPFLNLLGAQCLGWTSLMAWLIEALGDFSDAIPMGAKPFHAKDSVALIHVSSAVSASYMDV